jgi:hypothetical protein
LLRFEVAGTNYDEDDIRVLVSQLIPSSDNECPSYSCAEKFQGCIVMSLMKAFYTVGFVVRYFACAILFALSVLITIRKYY